MDIVKRLRGHVEDKDTDAWMTCDEAADEIEWLREALKDKEELIQYIESQLSAALQK